MNVLQMWKTDYLHGGGGAIAMYRLHTGLRDAGVNSKILCMQKTTDSPNSIKYSQNIVLKKIESRLKRIALKQGLNDTYRINSFLIRNHPCYKEADIINIHGIHGFFNYLALPILSRQKPTFYTLHDIWPYTGHCAYSYDCMRWETGCGKCPYPENNPPIQKDNTRVEWWLKDMVYRYSNLVIVTLSSQKTQEAQRSMLKRFPIYHIPNGVDTSVFKPLDSNRCRIELGLPENKNILMFAALSLRQPNKGGDFLMKALQELPHKLKSNLLLLTLGKGGELFGRNLEIETYNLGLIRDDHQKAVAYSAADIFVSPTRAETSGLVLQESMACGTPVVAFNVGGVPDVVRHKTTGYLAQAENAEDLCKGMVTLLEEEQLREEISQNDREMIIKEFTLERQVRRYIELYEDCLQKR